MKIKIKKLDRNELETALKTAEKYIISLNLGIDTETLLKASIMKEVYYKLRSALENSVLTNTTKTVTLNIHQAIIYIEALNKITFYTPYETNVQMKITTQIHQQLINFV